jgi:hypothetical protein
MRRFLLILSPFLLATVLACGRTEVPPPPPASAPPEAAEPDPGEEAAKAAQSLGEAMLAASEGAEGCDALAAAMTAALEGQSAAIEVLAQGAEMGGAISDADQQRLKAMADKAAECAGTAPGIEALVSGLQRPSVPLELESQSECESSCCLKGAKAWSATIVASAGCLGGDDQMCCLATTVASYNECLNLCPENDCCADVPASSPDGPPGGPPSQ